MPHDANAAGFLAGQGTGLASIPELTSTHNSSAEPVARLWGEQRARTPRAPAGDFALHSPVMTGSQDKKSFDCKSDTFNATFSPILRHSIPRRCLRATRCCTINGCLARIFYCERARPSTEMFNPGENVQPATNAHENASEQGQLHSSSRVA